MRRSWLRTLQGIERDLADSDPGMDALFRSFAWRTGGRDMSWVERVGHRRFPLFWRRHKGTPTDRMKDWTAGNWKDP